MTFVYSGGIEAASQSGHVTRSRSARRTRKLVT